MISYVSLQALMCSSQWYAGISALVGKECMRFDGSNYGMIWYTNYNHQGGAMTTFDYIRGCGNVPWNIGGGDYEDGKFHFECWQGSEWSGPWSTRISSDDQWLVGLKGFSAISVPYKLRKSSLQTLRNAFRWLKNNRQILFPF